MKPLPITYKEYAFVQEMAVAPDYRRRSIATALLAATRDWTRQLGLNQLRLLVANANPAARAAFERFGFQPSFQEMVLAVTETVPDQPPAP